MTQVTQFNPDVLSCLANLSNDEVFTPPKLVNDILDLLPAKLWKDQTPVNYCLPETAKSIIFSEWTPIGKKIKRKDYVFEALAKGSYQTTLFDENDRPLSFDNFIKEYKPVDFLKLGSNDGE